MKKIYNIAMLLGALAFTTSACTNSDNEPNYGEITLTTPVVTLDGVNATVSRAEPTKYTQMVLTVDLLDKNGSFTSGRSCTYKYGSGIWDKGSDQSLVVTGGEGTYYARAIAQRVYLENVENAIYVFKGEDNAAGTIKVASDGTFTLGAAMKPITSAIKVVLKDADGGSISSGYSVTMSGLKMVSAAKWDKTQNEVLLGEMQIKEPLEDLNKAYGYYKADTYTSGSTLMTVINENSVSYNVKLNSDLVLEAGKLYTFNITLGGDTEITINPTNGITVGDFVNGGNIDIER